MRILTRAPGQALRLGRDAKITIRSVLGMKVEIGVEAPHSLTVHKEELIEAVGRANQEALVTEPFARSVLAYF